MAYDAIILVTVQLQNSLFKQEVKRTFQIVAMSKSNEYLLNTTEI